MVGASADQTARIVDVASNGAPAHQVGGHDAPISSVRFFENSTMQPLIVTGSWDKTVRYWDLRQHRPLATIDLKDKVYSMDTQKKRLIVATAGLRFSSINLDNPTNIEECPQISNLKGETRVVRCFPDARGFVAGSTGGKAAVFWLGGTNDS